MPADLQWALEEQRQMWLVLCLRRPMPSGGLPSHPFAVCAAELCHSAQISVESEQYAAARVGGNRLEMNCYSRKILQKSLKIF